MGRERLQGSIYDRGLSRVGEGEIAGFNIRSGVKEWGRGRLQEAILKRSKLQGQKMRLQRQNLVFFYIPRNIKGTVHLFG